MADVKISDLILHGIEQRPIDFKDTFDTLLKDRLATAVDAKREQVARTLFNPVNDDEESEYEQEIESEEEENG